MERSIIKNHLLLADVKFEENNTMQDEKPIYFIESTLTEKEAFGELNMYLDDWIIEKNETTYTDPVIERLIKKRNFASFKFFGIFQKFIIFFIFFTFILTNHCISFQGISSLKL